MFLILNKMTDWKEAAKQITVCIVQSSCPYFHSPKAYKFVAKLFSFSFSLKVDLLVSRYFPIIKLQRTLDDNKQETAAINR